MKVCKFWRRGPGDKMSKPVSGDGGPYFAPTDLLIDDHARQLAERLGGLPLALATAGVYLRKSVLSFEQYLHEYERRWNLNPRRPVQLQEYRDRTLYTTWDLSYTRLEKDSADAAKLLKVLAYFDHQNIWYELLHAGANDGLPGWLGDALGDLVSFENIMGILVEYCFVEVQWTTKSYSMHMCVHDWTLIGLNKMVDLDSYWYAFDCIAKSIDSDEREFLGHVRYARLVPHASRLAYHCFIEVGVLSKIAEDRIRGAEDVAQLLQKQVQLTAATVILQQALIGKEKALGRDHTLTLNMVGNLGTLYGDQGKLDQAEQMYDRALAGYEKTLGRDHTSTLKHGRQSRQSVS